MSKKASPVIRAREARREKSGMCLMPGTNTSRKNRLAWSASSSTAITDSRPAAEHDLCIRIRAQIATPVDVAERADHVAPPVDLYDGKRLRARLAADSAADGHQQNSGQSARRHEAGHG